MNKIKDIYFFFVILFSGYSLLFYRSKEGWIILWVIGFFLFFNETVKHFKKLFIPLSVWIGYFIINALIIKGFHSFFLITYIIRIMIAFWLLIFYKERFFLKYENIIYYLTILSLVFYAVQLIAPSFMYNVIGQLDLSQNLFPKTLYASISIYTFHQVNLNELFPRNAGFCWEPGPFSGFIVLAIFFNIARNNVQLKDKKRLFILTIALITTQSTTGFVALLAVILWFAWSHYKNWIFRLISIPVSITVILLLFIYIPFLNEKITRESEQNLYTVLNNAEKYNTTYAPGRFASFQLRLMDFINHPIAGYGGKSTLQAGYFSESSRVAAINGLGTIMGKYGSIGLLIFLILIFKTGKWLSNYYHYTGYFIFPALILIIAFGFGIIESPIIVTMWMAPVFLKKTRL